jgi:hypothetical protein
VLKEDRRGLIDDLSLSDSSLQDALQYADEVVVTERTEAEQLYIDFDIVSGARSRALPLLLRELPLTYCDAWQAAKRSTRR